MSDASNSRKLSFGMMLRYRAEAALFFFFIGLFRVMGVTAASNLGGFIGRNILARTSATKRARDHLALAFPEKPQAEREAIIREMWDSIGRTVGEYAHLDKFSIHGTDPRIEIANLEIVDRLIAEKTGIMFISGHFANWEVMPIAAAQYGINGGEVYRPVNNPHIDKWLVEQRAKNGPKEQISKGAHGTRRIFTLLRGGQSIFLLVDQKTNEGVAAPFFGRPAMTTPAPAALALKLNVPLLPVSIERVGPARFRMAVHEPIRFEPGGDHDRDVLALTERINESIEQMVRYRPSQWLWIHRRWPKPGDRARSRRGVASTEQTVQAGGGLGLRVDNDGSSLS